MRAIIIYLLLIIPVTAIADDGWTDKITPEITLKAVKLFRTDPTGKDADGALSVISNFAVKSPDVLVELSPKYFAWKLGSINEDIESKFVGAFIAGNIEYQLINKIKQNRPVEGIQLMLFTYIKLKKAGKIQEITMFEEWLILNRNNALEEKLK